MSMTSLFSGLNGGGWNPYQTFAPQLSGASQFSPLQFSGANMLGNLAASPAGGRLALPQFSQGVADRLAFSDLAAGSAAAGAPLASAGRWAMPGVGAAGVGAAEAAAPGLGGLAGAATGAAPKLGQALNLGAIEGGPIAATGKLGLLKNLLARPRIGAGIKGAGIGLGAQFLANQVLGSGLEQMASEGGGRGNVGQFGLGVIKSLPEDVALGMAVGGPVGAVAGVGLGIAAGVADAVFDFSKGKAKVPEALDTFMQAVQFDPTWTAEDKQAITSQIALAKAAGNDNSAIIQSLILPAVTNHQAQIQQYQQNQQQMQLQQQNLAGQSAAIGKASQPILDLLAANADTGYQARTAALNTPGVDPAYAAITRDLASQQADTQRLMAASLYQQALAAPYQSYYTAIQDQNKQLATLGNQVQSGYIQNVAKQFLDQQSGNTKSAIDQILSGQG